MSRGVLSRINGWRFRKKSHQGGGGHGKPQVPKHVREPDPPEVFASKLNGRQPIEATDNSVASPATALTDDSESRFGAKDSISNVLADHESPSKDSELYQIDSRVDAPLPNVEIPERVQSSSMSVLSRINSNDAQRTVLSSRDDLPRYSRDSEEAHSPMDFQDPKGSNFVARVEPSSLETRLETASVSPLNGKHPETGSSPKSIPNTSPNSITNNSPNGHMTATSDLTGNGPIPESIPDEFYRQESILDRQDHQAPLADISEHPESSLDNQDQQTAPADILDHPQSIFEATEHQDSALIALDHPVFVPEENNHPQPIPGGDDHPESILHRAEYQDPNLVAVNQPKFIPDKKSYPEPISDERNHPPPILDEKIHPEPISKQPAPSEHISDVQNYPKVISDTQSRSESIVNHGSSNGRDQQTHVNHESSNGRDQQTHVNLEARLHRFRWRSLKTRALVSERRTELYELRNEISDADAEFIKMSRESWVSGSHDDVALEASWKKLQALRDAYGPLEQVYDTLEERLDREEYELAELEESMFENGVPKLESHDSDLEPQLDGLDEEHPLFKEYMARLGDSNLLHEAYSELLSENDSLLKIKEASQRSGRVLTLESETTLAKFYAQQTKWSEDLRQVGADVERLQLECIRKGLLPEEEGNENDILQTFDGSVDPEQAEYNKFPWLLARPGEDEDEKRSKELLSQFKSGDTGDRITRWLLHKLRSSCSEVELLARYTDGLDRTVDTQKWQEEVLYFWFMDSANLPPSAYELDPTLTAVPSSTLTDPNKVQHKLFGEKHFIELVVRSSSLSKALEFGMLLKLARMKGRSAVTN
jgi:hypothetical protein